MDTRAELTLRCARLLQEHRGAEGSLDFWFFLPEFHNATWDEARELLSKAPKPPVVSPRIEPGMLATWSLDVMGPALREWGAALVGGESADAFLGTQGDVWDTQWDMFLALIGAIVAQVVLGRVHDRALQRLG